MSFEFLLLSLVMMFLLIVVYYSKNSSNILDNKIFRSILLITHIIVITFCGLYVESETGNVLGIFSKTYLIFVGIWFGLVSVYYVVKLLKAIFKENSDKYKKIFSNIMVIFTVIQVIFGIFTMVGPVSYSSTYNNVDYYGHFVIYFISCYLIVEFLVLLMGIKRIDKKSYAHLVVIFIIELVMFFLQGRSLELPIYNLGMVFIVFYSYFMMENIEHKELEVLRLERDYAMRQNIDRHEFLKVLSHEIRIPLNTIDGFSQVILDSDSMDDVKADVNDIRLASRDLIDVINGMIDLSIIESGNLEIINENYNVYDMLDDVVGITKSKMRDKSVEFKVDISNDIPEVLLGDSERISQVILNLLTNSIKYTDKGDISLKVSSVKNSSRCRLKIIVSDTGKGIKREDLNTIFEGKSKKDGVTLGLSVSKYLLDLMGGAIEVESTYGKGSEFIVTLDQKIISDVTLEKGSRKRSFAPFKALGKRILLVDDNKLNLKVASRLLEAYEVEVVEANSGRECLDILDNDTNFDLILMDDLMPEMSGTECLDILKKIERVDGYYIPVVVLTANATSGMKEKYLNIGFEDYLAKPIDKYELDRILKKYLKGKK